MRNLQSSDIFSACRLMSAIGVKEEFKALAEKATLTKDKNTMMDAGYELIFTLLEKATTSKAEQEWYKFLGNIFEVKPEEVKTMDPCDVLDNMLEVANVQKWRDFFSRVLQLMKRS